MQQQSKQPIQQPLVQTCPCFMCGLLNGMEERFRQIHLLLDQTRSEIEAYGSFLSHHRTVLPPTNKGEAVDPGSKTVAIEIDRQNTGSFML